MRPKCHFPLCEVRGPEVRWWDMLLTCLLEFILTGDYHWWVCPEHRFTEEEWDDLEQELRRQGKII